MKRLESLDVLRGIDLFLLVIVVPLVHSFNRSFDAAWFAPVSNQFDHVPWTGFHVIDIVMPLFLFMAGVAIPFAQKKYKSQSRSEAWIWGRLIKRFIILWIFGMITQGRLLSLRPELFRYYDNTLQTIAVGYLFASIFYMYTTRKAQIISAAGLLVLFWGLMMFVKVGGFGGGDFGPNNLCEWVDRTVLGTHCDHWFIDDNGNGYFRAEHNYTWILSSLGFIVTTMTGMFAGELLMDPKRKETNKLAWLFGAGAGMLAAGLLWSLQMPSIKHIWTSSFVLISSGICFLLLGVVYFIVDYKGWKKGFMWLKVFGLNSILAYMIAENVDFSSVSKSLLYGVPNVASEGVYRFLLTLCSVLILWGILKLFDRCKIYLKA